MGNRLSSFIKKKIIGKGGNLVSLDEPYQMMAHLLWNYPVTGMIDAGASDGRISRRLLREFPAAHVYAFEPNPLYAEALRQYAKDDPRFHPQFLALSDHEGTATLHVTESPGSTSLFTPGNRLRQFQPQDAAAMPQLLREISRRPDTESLVAKRGLIRAFAETVGRMHARGICHGDLRLGNVLAVADRDRWRFYFIDNERTRKFRSLPARLRLKNLVQVNMFLDGISNTDRLRFFARYLESNPELHAGCRKWAARITARTNRRLRTRPWFNA